ncbi:A/G-specific adenine glycosylase [Sinomicrobium soli]|uniref:A/G-specific adenine glycosylase n=1 Tax=Sinomicrobium sp. N-1-3-6 TaxID=2219864 RepID=UPI000DCB5F0D|nr:A/G-specific adenine glycosylase [Sinomicrobium sp. N-1-3-6]RAV28116.1 A/G-specific adenine glycosylase [Sinomicrobium sp. N-1-3-6]
MNFSKTITDWYRTYKRDLPWRKTTDPYCIWLSEIMLQQTRVEQGLPYYLKFTAAYPTVFDLAAAPEDEVLKLWQGLGYYSRARNLHHTARYVAEELGGRFPSSYKELLKLKGIGDYTASAIASISFNEAAAVVDGNVYRVLSRYFGVAIPVNASEGVKYFKELAGELIDRQDPATFNQAIMEFGAIQCSPRAPKCHECPLNDGCVALRDDKVQQLPVKIRKNSIRHRYFHYLVIEHDEYTVLQQRKHKDIWQHLYEFPLIEADGPLDKSDIEHHKEFRKLVGDSPFRLEQYGETVIHKLSHQHIHASFWVVYPGDPVNGTVRKSEVGAYPVPVLIANFVREYEF